MYSRIIRQPSPWQVYHPDGSFPCSTILISSSVRPYSSWTRMSISRLVSAPPTLPFRWWALGRGWPILWRHLRRRRPILWRHLRRLRPILRWLLLRFVIYGDFENGCLFRLLLQWHDLRVLRIPSALHVRLPVRGPQRQEPSAHPNRSPGHALTRSLRMHRQ